MPNNHFSDNDADRSALKALLQNYLDRQKVIQVKNKNELCLRIIDKTSELPYLVTLFQKNNIPSEIKHSFGLGRDVLQIQCESNWEKISELLQGTKYEKLRPEELPNSKDYIQNKLKNQLNNFIADKLVAREQIYLCTGTSCSLALFLGSKEQLSALEKLFEAFDPPINTRYSQTEYGQVGLRIRSASMDQFYALLSDVNRKAFDELSYMGMDMGFDIKAIEQEKEKEQKKIDHPPAYKVDGLNAGMSVIQNERDYQEDRSFVSPFVDMGDEEAKVFLKRTISALEEETKVHKATGSTVTAAIVTNVGNIVTAHLGDSPAAAIVYDPATQSAELVALTTPHTPSEEFKYISDNLHERQGKLFHQVRNDFANTIAVNRSLGDIEFGIGLLKNPDINIHDLSQYHKEGKRVFLLVGSDGICLNEKSICPNFAELIAKELRKNPDADLAQLAGKISHASLPTGDNITTTLVEVKPGVGAIMGVFDGHGGVQTSETAVNEFIRIVNNARKNGINHAFDHRLTKADIIQPPDINEAYRLALEMMNAEERKMYLFLEAMTEYGKYHHKQKTEVQLKLVTTPMYKKYEASQKLFSALDGVSHKDHAAIKAVLEKLNNEKAPEAPSQQQQQSQLPQALIYASPATLDMQDSQLRAAHLAHSPQNEIQHPDIIGLHTKQTKSL